MKLEEIQKRIHPEALQIILRFAVFLLLIGISLLVEAIHNRIPEIHWAQQRMVDEVRQIPLPLTANESNSEIHFSFCYSYALFRYYCTDSKKDEIIAHYDKEFINHGWEIYKNTPGQYRKGQYTAEVCGAAGDYKVDGYEIEVAWHETW